jgi:hypothetical protein
LRIVDELIETLWTRYWVKRLQIDGVKRSEFYLRGFKVSSEPTQEKGVSGKFIRNTRNREKVRHTVLDKSCWVIGEKGETIGEVREGPCDWIGIQLSDNNRSRPLMRARRT